MSLNGLSLRDLEYAVALDGRRHFGRAAAQCGVSQPTLSEQIRKLESVLGLALFERGGRRVIPSARGEAVLRQAETVLAEARRLLDLARHQGEPLSGPLRLGAIATLGPYYFPHLLREVRAAFPALAIRLSEGRTAELIEQIRRGDLDAALLALPLATPGLFHSVVFFEPFFLVCPAGHDLARIDPLRLDDLPDRHLLLLDEGHCLRDQALALCGHAARASRHATGLETLWHMIAAGEGYSLLPALSLHHRQMTDGLVTSRALDEAEAGREIALVWREADPRGPEFRALAGFLGAHAPADVIVAAR